MEYSLWSTRTNGKRVLFLWGFCIVATAQSSHHKAPAFNRCGRFMADLTVLQTGQ